MSTEKSSNEEKGNVVLADVSGSLPVFSNGYDLQLEQLKELEKVIEKRIKELEGNDR